MSKSTKSASASEHQERRLKKGSLEKCRLRRLFFNRKVEISSLTIDQMPYLWAAYRMGVWKDTFKDDLTKDEFTLAVSDLSEMTNILAIIAPNGGKQTPVGVIIAGEGVRYIEPHVDWFPWATDRNKLEGIIRGILTLREIKPLFIWCDERDIDFYAHVSKYGILRRVGTFNGDKKYSIFQSKEKKKEI